MRINGKIVDEIWTVSFDDQSIRLLARTIDGLIYRSEIVFGSPEEAAIISFVIGMSEEDHLAGWAYHDFHPHQPTIH